MLTQHQSIWCSNVHEHCFLVVIPCSASNLTSMKSVYFSVFWVQTQYFYSGHIKGSCDYVHQREHVASFSVVVFFLKITSILGSKWVILLMNQYTWKLFFQYHWVALLPILMQNLPILRFRFFKGKSAGMSLILWKDEGISLMSHSVYY